MLAGLAPGHRDTGGNGEHDKLREVRSEGDGVPEREPQQQIPDVTEVRETGGEDAGSGGRGEPDDGRAGGQLLKEQPEYILFYFLNRFLSFIN